MTPEELERLNASRGTLSTTRDNVVDKVIPSTPGNTPQDLNRYLSEQKTAVNQYGPEQEKMVLDQILKDRNSLGETIKRGTIGFSDAIMQGVARAGNPGNLAAYDARKGKEEEMRANAIPALQEMNLKQVEGNQSLDRMSGDNALGASFQAPLAAFFRKAGVPEEEIAGMLANPAAARGVVDPFASLMGNEQKMQMELLLNQMQNNSNEKRAVLQSQSEKEKLAAQERKDAEEKAERANRDKVSAAEKLSKMGFIDKNITKRDEAKILREAAGIGGGLDESKAARLAELRRKKAEGSLGK